MSPVETAIARWRRKGYSLNPGATRDELTVLEKALGVPLPMDVAAYFSMANGMVDNEPDDYLASFWSIARITSDPYVTEVTSGPGHYRDTAFADVLISSWFCSFRVRPGIGLSIFVESVAEELASLDVFFERYLESPRSLNL